MHISERISSYLVTISYYMRKIEEKEGVLFSIAHEDLVSEFFRCEFKNDFKGIKILLQRLKDLEANTVKAKPVDITQQSLPLD